jgi:creatinine amidohydrolase
MTAPEFAQAVSRSGATCIIPCGILAGETETSLMMTHRPELAHVDRAKQQGGEDQKRLGLPDVYTAIWWYARFPNHYGGDGSAGTRDLGEALLNRQVDSLVRMISTQ